VLDPFCCGVAGLLRRPLALYVAAMSERIDPDVVGDDRTSLLTELDFQRGTVRMKAAGLSDEAAAHSLVPSPTTVTGVVQHLAEVERSWFRAVLAGDGWRSNFDYDADPDAEFRVTSETSLAAVLLDYEAACDESRQAYADVQLDDVARGPRSRPPLHPTLRWILVHMIAETARHNGQLDILREQLDGAVGE